MNTSTPDEIYAKGYIEGQQQMAHAILQLLYEITRSELRELLKKQAQSTAAVYYIQ